MNLADVLTALLSAEDEAADSVEEAKRKASDILREAREKFAADQEARLNAARAQAKAIVESARHSAELEAAQISDMGPGAAEDEGSVRRKGPLHRCGPSPQTAERHGKRRA
ncbi:hypothetical protein MASR2M17_20920 [Aminivibrio sp.]